MNARTDQDANDNHELLEQIADYYLSRLQAGEPPDRAALLATFPDIRLAREAKFQLVEKMHRGAQGRRMGEWSLTGDTTQGRSPDAPVHTVSPPGQPTRIGRYEIRKELGRGASGVVYEAYDPTCTRTIALKVFRAERLTDPDYVERFHREARTAAQLQHPNIVQLLDSGEHDSILYLSTVFVPGGSLQARLDEKVPIPLREAASLVRKLAAALECMHGLDIIHRDVKPLNILLKTF